MPRFPGDSREIPGRFTEIPGRLHPNDDNVAQARGPKIRPKIGMSCRRLVLTHLEVRQFVFDSLVEMSAAESVPKMGRVADAWVDAIFL